MRFLRHAIRVCASASAFFCASVAGYAADSAGALGSALPVCVFDESQQFPVGVIKANGDAFVVWHDFRAGVNERDLYGQRLDANAVPLWQPNGKPLVALTGSQGWPQIVDDPNGSGFFLLWGDSRNGGTDLYAQRFDGDGHPLWNRDGVAISVHAEGKDDHTAIPDGSGGFYAAWEDWRNGNQDIYGQHVAASGEPLWAPNGSPICDASGDQYDPSIAPDGSGGLVAAWWNVAPERWNAVAQRMSPDGKRLWNPAGVALAESAANQSGPVIAGDALGGAYVFWTDYRNDDGSMSDVDVYGQRVGADGARLWGDAGTPVTRQSGNQQSPCVAVDGKGGVYVAWLDTRDVYDDIYLQRFAPDGSKSWDADGFQVCLAEGRQRDPRVALAGGGVWVLWYDYRRESEDHTHQDIYAQRVDARGSALAPTEGLPMHTAAGERSALGFVSRDGWLLATWMELRGDDSDIYAWRNVAR